MARPTRQGVDYFPLDVNLDSKFKFIEIKYGLEGFAIVIKILQQIYSAGYWYKFDEDEKLLFAHEINVDINLVNDVIMETLTRDIFDKHMYEQYQILTSKGIQKRYKDIVKRRKDVEIVSEYLLINGDFGVNAYIIEINVSNNYTTSVVIDSKSTQSKVKESKVKESIYNAQPYFDTFWNNYPRKESKQKTLDWFEKNKPNEELLEKILSSLEKFKKTSQWQDKQFIPHPTTWLNQKRWEDEVDLSTVTNRAGKATAPVPDWYDSYKSDLIKKEDNKKDTSMSNEEIEKILNEIDEVI